MATRFNVRSKHRLIYLRCAARRCHCLIGPEWRGLTGRCALVLAGAVCQVWGGVVLPDNEVSKMLSSTYASGPVVPAVINWMLRRVASPCVARHIH